MSSDSKGYRVQIIIAVIGVAGVLGAALITNWDKIFGPGGGGTPPGSKQQGDQSRPPAVATGAPWQQQGSYGGDCRNAPAGTICAGFDDGYVWLVRGAIIGWEKRVEGGQTIQVAVASTGRYEHILGTNRVRTVR